MQLMQNQGSEKKIQLQTTNKKVKVKSISPVHSLGPHGLQPTRLLRPWDSPGKNTGVGCHFLLQEIFLTQGLNPGLPHCRQMLYHLSHQGNHTNKKQSKKVPGGSDGKKFACSVGDPGSIPRPGGSPGEGNGYPLRYSCLLNSMDRKAWQAIIYVGSKESDTTELLTFHFQSKNQECSGLFTVLFIFFVLRKGKEKLIPLPFSLQTRPSAVRGPSPQLLDWQGMLMA